jgi:hypothetical protein
MRLDHVERITVGALAYLMLATPFRTVEEARTHVDRRAVCHVERLLVGW